MTQRDFNIKSTINNRDVGTPIILAISFQFSPAMIVGVINSNKGINIVLEFDKQQVEGATFFMFLNFHLAHVLVQPLRDSGGILTTLYIYCSENVYAS